MASLGQEDKPGGGRCMISWLRRMDVCGTKLIGRDRLPPCSPSSTECLHAGPCICSAPGWVLHAGPASPPLLVGAGCPIRLLCSEPGARDLDHCSSRTGTEQTVSFSPRPASLGHSPCPLFCLGLVFFFSSSLTIEPTLYLF